jgi:RNA polymerase sigma-70 factor, ECF subfamily
MSPTETRDRALALAFKNGEREAYARIYELHRERVLNLCKRMLGNKHDAEEATQETFLRVYQGLSRFNGRYLLRAWILRIATNVCLDTIRIRGRRPVSVELDECIELTHDEDADPQHVVLRSSESSSVRRVLKKMPPLHRAALVLRDLEGLSYDEIAVVLAMTPPQVKALIHRARQGFKRSWPTHLAEMLIPARLLHRMRDTGSLAPDASHVGSIASSAAPYAATCSNFIQQCGAFAADRAASIVVAVVVGTSAVGGLAAAGGGPPEPRDVAAGATTVETSDRVAAKKIHHRKAPQSQPVTAPQEVPAPVADPTTGPAPEQTSEPAPEPSESAPAPAPSEPSGFTLGFSAPVGPGYACSCAGKPAVSSSSTVLKTSSGLQSFKQALGGSATVDGAATYGLSVEQSGDPSRHDAYISLSTDEGAYVYAAHGSFVSAQATAWGGMTYTYEGSYHLTSSPTRTEQVPEAGNYRVTLIFSANTDRIVAVSFQLS